jgi:hypothetical protein
VSHSIRSLIRIHFNLGGWNFLSQIVGASPDILKHPYQLRMRINDGETKGSKTGDITGSASTTLKSSE